ALEGLFGASPIASDLEARGQREALLPRRRRARVRRDQLGEGGLGGLEIVLREREARQPAEGHFVAGREAEHAAKGDVRALRVRQVDIVDVPEREEGPPQLAAILRLARHTDERVGRVLVTATTQL